MDIHTIQLMPILHVVMMLTADDPKNDVIIMRVIIGLKQVGKAMLLIHSSGPD